MPAAKPTLAEMLATPVEFVRGVGPRAGGAPAAARRADGGATSSFFFPRDYQDLSDRRAIAELDEEGAADRPRRGRGGRRPSSGFGKSQVGVLVRQGNDYLRAIVVQSAVHAREVSRAVSTCCSRRSRGCAAADWEMSHPRVTWLDGAEDEPEMRLLPLYPLTEGLSQYQMRRMVAGGGRANMAPALEEVFPERLLANTI